jgi:hypothetical protein
MENGSEISYGEFEWDISNLTPGSNYFVYAKITNHWNISFYNYSVAPIIRLHMPAPKNFTILDNFGTSGSFLIVHNRNPVLSWLPPANNFTSNSADLDYILKIWLGTDKTGDKVFETTTKTTEVEVSKNLDYGQKYFAEVFGRLPDGNESMKSSLQFVLSNHPPIAPVIQIIPEEPKTTSDLNCTIISKSLDSEGDPITYLYYWFKNDNPQPDYDNKSIIPSIATAKGEHWRCMVIPYDNIDLGDNSTYKVIIRNSAPTITIESPKPDNEYMDNKGITFKFKVTDSDPGDVEKIQYIVFNQKTKEPIKSGYVQSGTGIVEFQKDLPKWTYNLIINVSDGSASSEIPLNITVKAHKEEGFAEMMLSAFYGIVLLIIVLILIFIFLLFRVQGVKEGEGEEKSELEKERRKGLIDLAEEPTGEELDEEADTDEDLDMDELAPEELEEEELEEDIPEEETVDEEMLDEEPVEDKRPDEMVMDEEEFEE